MYIVQNHWFHGVFGCAEGETPLDKDSRQSIQANAQEFYLTQNLACGFTACLGNSHGFIQSAPALKEKQGYTLS